MTKQDQLSSVNPNQLIKDLVQMMEKLVLDDFNYFPAIINSIQTALLHVFKLDADLSVGILKSNENVLKRLVLNLCKIFTKSTNNLEDDNFRKTSSFKDCVNAFILNVDLLKFVINKFEDKYWLNDVTESCMLQCLYALFEKFIQKNENSDLMYSIFEMFFTFANGQIEHLAKSDFNTRTCLLAVKLFEYSSFNGVSLHSFIFEISLSILVYNYLSGLKLSLGYLLKPN